jgi:hypothetical protein
MVRSARIRTTRRLVALSAIALCALVTLFVAAPTTSMSRDTEGIGTVVETSGEAMMPAKAFVPTATPRLVSPRPTVMVAVLLAVFGISVFGYCRQRDREHDRAEAPLTLWWVQRRGPPRMA